MPYKIILTLVSGQQFKPPGILHGPTPQKDNMITVDIGNRATRAKVNEVRTYPSKSPQTAVEVVDEVYAQEL